MLINRSSLWINKHRNQMLAKGSLCDPGSLALIFAVRFVVPRHTIRGSTPYDLPYDSPSLAVRFPIPRCPSLHHRHPLYDSVSLAVWYCTFSRSWFLQDQLIFFFFFPSESGLIYLSWSCLENCVSCAGRKDMQMYDPIHRNPLYCGANHSTLWELQKVRNLQVTMVNKTWKNLTSSLLVNGWSVWACKKHKGCSVSMFQIMLQPLHFIT